MLSLYLMLFLNSFASVFIILFVFITLIVHTSYFDWNCLVHLVNNFIKCYISGVHGFTEQLLHYRSRLDSSSCGSDFLSEPPQPYPGTGSSEQSARKMLRRVLHLLLVLRQSATWWWWWRSHSSSGPTIVRNPFKFKKGNLNLKDVNESREVKALSCCVEV